MRISKYYRSFLRRKLNQQNRSRLKNEKFSIISSNCVGGIITHELGQRFNSPTINLYFNPDDFLKFAKDMQYYLFECQLMQDMKKTNERGYPVGRLDDITIYFVHYSSFQSAKNKWEERIERINWNNMYFIMTQRDGCTKEQIIEFDRLPYKNKVSFTIKPYEEIKSAYFIENSLQEDGEVMDLNLYRSKFTGVRVIDNFDYVGFLNHKWNE